MTEAVRLLESAPPALAALEGPMSADDVEALLAATKVPAVLPGTSTFLWHGEADSVAVEHRVGGLPLPLPLRRTAGADLWHATVTLPEGSRVEYRVLVRRGDTVESTLDTLNPRVAVGPAGEMSVLEAHGYATPDWAEHDPEAPPGQLTEVAIASRSLRRRVAVALYAPARPAPSGRHPLLVVHDGGDFLEHAGFGVVLDNLMHRRLIAESFVAFVSPRDRMREYGAGRAHSRFLAEELVPELEAKLPLQGDPCGRVLLGASLGAVASLAAAARAPGMFGGLMLESGSFRATLSDLRQAPPRLRSMVRFLRSLQRDAPHVTHRVFQAYGRFEPLVDANRTMTATLRRMADEVRVVEALDGHNWTAWRDRLLDGLGWLLPPEAEAAARPAGEVVVP